MAGRREAKRKKMVGSKELRRKGRNRYQPSRIYRDDAGLYIV